MAYLVASMSQPSPRSSSHQTTDPTPEHLQVIRLPLALQFLPLRLRYPLALIYKFARQAYELSVMENLPPEQRLQALEHYKQALDRIADHAQAETMFFTELQNMMTTYQLPLAPFYDLLEANTERVSKPRFKDFGELMHFSRRSANPLGRLILQLLGACSQRNIGYADTLASALQTIYFLKNVGADTRDGRIYFPQDEMRKYKITDEQILHEDISGIWVMFFDFELQRARRLLQSAAPLGLQIKGLAGLEIRMLIAGGERILLKLHKSRGDVFHKPPVLNPIDWVYMIYRAIRAK